LALGCAALTRQIVLLHYATFLCTTLNSPLTERITPRTHARSHARTQCRIRAECGELYGTRRPARKTNVTGHIKNIATTAMGFVFFDSTAISLYSVWGIALGLVGSVLYSISKLRNT
jgi:hypothetical protein